MPVLSPASPQIASGPHAFSDAEMDAIVRLGDSLALCDAALGGYGRVDPAKRIAKVAQIESVSANLWIYERVYKLVTILNRGFGLTLSPFCERLQYMVYRDIDGGHFGWHVDQGPTQKRQLSLTLQLTDGGRYEGCNLEFRNGEEIQTAPRARGTLIAFPSHVLHRVTPITAGTRRSIVAWVP